MKITTVTYGRSVEFSRRRKSWFAWTAEVDVEFERAEEVLDKLRAEADEAERREFARYGDNRPEPSSPLPVPEHPICDCENDE
jgi:hypothetical protein